MSAPREARATLRVPAEHPALPGHFPGQPLVPGVVLLECAVQLAREAFALGALRGVPLLKFVAPIAPETDFDCVVAARDDGRVSFCIERDGQIAAQGSLRFGD
ncbi:hypothetical protein [Solimonas soli]|uniref:hypothetical protein n=1 Tax=Solimonas soli TaxID=413479 RepID=UPI0004829704|nr:hypothetical protein [Solimonas soli]